jgi:hypothetical protein
VRGKRKQLRLTERERRRAFDSGIRALIGKESLLFEEFSQLGRENEVAIAIAGILGDDAIPADITLRFDPDRDGHLFFDTQNI